MHFDCKEDFLLARASLRLCLRSLHTLLFNCTRGVSHIIGGHAALPIILASASCQIDSPDTSEAFTRHDKFISARTSPRRSVSSATIMLRVMLPLHFDGNMIEDKISRFHSADILDQGLHLPALATPIVTRPSAAICLVRKDAAYLRHQ